MSAKRRRAPSRSGRASERAVFLERIARIYGVGADAALAMTSTPAGSSVRINPLSPLPRAEILERLAVLEVVLDPIAWCPGAYHLAGDKSSIASSPLFEEGHVYLQNASSLIPPLVLAPREGEAILDVCAAPGGKTIHLAGLTANRARIWANDAIRPRARKLETLLSRYGAKVEAVSEHPGQYLDKYVDRHFDRILLDAQCTGEGMLDLAHPNALRFWSLARVRKNSFLQKRMLASAFRVLAPGGTLVYSTCTHAPEENEWPVSQLLRHNEDARVDAIDLDLPNRRPGLSGWEGERFDPGLRDAMRVMPAAGMEAFFVCRITRGASAC